MTYKLCTQQGRLGMSSQFGKNNSELNNPLKERIKLLMTAEELEKPYSFATRVGLSKGTFTGIWVEGRTSLQMKTAQKIAAATGSNPVWVMTGEGEQFKQDQIQQSIQQDSKPYVIQAVEIKPKKPKNQESSIDLAFKTALDIHQPEHNQELHQLLTACYEATEGALAATYTMMDPAVKAEFLIKFMQALTKVPDLYEEQTLLLAIFSIELPLYQARQSMSLNDKVQLISDIYKLYDSNAEMKKATLSEYLKYREGNNSGRGRAQ